MKLLKIIFGVCGVGVALLFASSVMAQGNTPFYFVGKAADAASLSNVGRGDRKVFLRWDVLEGSVPADIISFNLYRDDTLLQSFPAAEVMPSDEIVELYQGEAQQRRKFETLAALKNQVLADPSFQDFPLNDFGTAVRQRIVTDDVWATLASRVDFNIARARYRAYLDSPPPGDYEYELKAVNGVGVERRVGLFRVNTNDNTNVIAPAGISQVPLGECDTPDIGEDHFTVALSWPQPGGNSAADQLASRVFISGYDLYRTQEDAPEGDVPVPARDLAAEARALGHDTQGRIAFSDLEKVNDVLLTLGGAENGEAIFIETKRDLIEDGLGLGDRRFYYLVPRDFTGQYGPTVATLVEVPNRGRPPAPWDIVSFPDQAADTPELELYWDEINFDSYQRNFGDVNQFCNSAEAQLNGRLEVVGASENCETDPRRSIRLDITGYNVYRFDSFEEASRFSDSDGDGVSDTLERPNNSQCDAKVLSDPAESRLLQVTQEIFSLPQANRSFVRIRDGQPAQDRNELYWYRIASRTGDGRLSFLSSPTQAKFPDRTLPAQPDMTLEKDDLENCGCDVVVTDPNAPWSFTDTIGLSSEFNLFLGSSSNPNTSETGDQSIHQFNTEASPLCRFLSDDSVNAEVTGIAEYPALTEKDTRLFCSTTFSPDVNFCQSGAVELRRSACAKIPVEDGEVVAGSVEAKLNFPEGSCGSLYTSVLGVKTRVATSCGTLTPDVLTVELDDPSVCGSYAVSQDRNNAQSQPVYLPCVKPLPAQPVNTLTAAKPLGFDVAAAAGNFRWQLPVEPVSASIVEFERVEDSATVVTTVGAGDTTVVSSDEVSIEFPPLLSAGETWCARVRLIGTPVPGREAVQSEWTQPLCGIREGELAPPQFLPWPSVAEAPRGDDIEFKIGHEIGASRSVDSYQPVWEMFTQIGLDAQCDIDGAANLADPAQRLLYANPLCPISRYADIQRDFSPFLNMIVYRQGRSPDGVEGDYVQVTPRLDRVHWDDVLFGKDVQGRQLNDPWFRSYVLEPGVDNWAFAFVDRYPLLAGYSYRYQVVQLSGDNRIIGWRQSNWVTPSLQGGQ